MPLEPRAFARLPPRGASVSVGSGDWLADFMDNLEQIKSYLGNGGLFNPEMMEHDKVRDLIISCRDEIERLRELRVAVLAYERITDTEYGLGARPDEEKAYNAEFLRLLRALRTTSANVKDEPRRGQCGESPSM